MWKAFGIPLLHPKALFWKLMSYESTVLSLTIQSTDLRLLSLGFRFWSTNKVPPVGLSFFGGWETSLTPPVILYSPLTMERTTLFSPSFWSFFSPGSLVLTVPFILWLLWVHYFPLSVCSSYFSFIPFHWYKSMK